ncbi:beta-lactamase/transpeptidase-like protein [Xylariaceae sp. FL0804]|nr:beta-lactamase/transpeptidase-like protein [Xylariaceae sp. FL0804]
MAPDSSEREEARSRRLAATLDAESGAGSPGGAIAVLRDGEVLARRVWGFADLARGVPMTPETQMPICSISKQMLCLAMVDLSRRPTPAMMRATTEEEDAKEEGEEERRQSKFWRRMDADLRTMLPQLFSPAADAAQEGEGEKKEKEKKKKDVDDADDADDADGELTVEHLHTMQSGLRDYWAMTVLWGAQPEGAFSLASDAPAALERTRSFHFRPGTDSSYCNLNFHILARMLERVSGQSLGQLLSERVFVPAGMATALLQANTAGHPLPCVGHEGSAQQGYTPAVNRIEWSGDAGIVASLDDMISYERYLDRSWVDDGSNYRDIAGPQTWRVEITYRYSFGLVHRELDEIGHTLGHGGALRGFRLHRVHVPGKRVSVVVMFNHEADAAAAAERILRAVLDVDDPRTPPPVALDDCDSRGWDGSFLEPDSGLVLSTALDRGSSAVSLRYGAYAEKLLHESPYAYSRKTSLELEGHVLRMVREDRHRAETVARRLPPVPGPGPALALAAASCAGVYRCDDANSTFTCVVTGAGAGGGGAGGGGALYGAFAGYLGRGPMHLMRPVGDGDVWLLACPRGMDAPAPGEWSVIFHRSGEGSGEVVGVTVGCPLALKVRYAKVAG